MNINNYTGYCLIYREPSEIPPGLSHVTQPRFEQWQCVAPLTIYPTLQELIDATPGFDKKRHIVGQVSVHLLAERVEVVSVKFPGEE